MYDMTVQQLINFLNTIEDKNQVVTMNNFDFTSSYPVKYAIEIKKSSDEVQYPTGVCLIGDL